MTTLTSKTRVLTKIIETLDMASIHYGVELQPYEARYLAYTMFNHHGGMFTHGITPWQLYRLIKLIDQAIPRQNYGSLNSKPNPNNGHAHHWYKFGKEYSRVLYVTVACAYLSSNPELAREIMKGITGRLQALADHYQASEFSADSESTIYSVTFRFWWD